jgi:type IV pilus assembly protein PilQ
LAAVAPLALVALAAPAHAQSEARHMSVSWAGVPIHDVLHAFAAYSGFSIVAGAGVTGFVTADINDQPWDVALRTILTANGLVAVEDEYGMIRVDDMTSAADRETAEPLVTRSYRISYSRASEIQAAITSVLSPRDTSAVVASSNTLVVSDIERVQRTVAALLR